MFYLKKLSQQSIKNVDFSKSIAKIFSTRVRLVLWIFSCLEQFSCVNERYVCITPVSLGADQRGPSRT